MYTIKVQTTTKHQKQAAPIKKKTVSGPLQWKAEEEKQVEKY